MTYMQTVSLALLYFCLPLIPLGASWVERDVCLLHVRMPEQEEMLYRDSVSLTVNPGLPGASSCFASTESCYMHVELGVGLAVL